MKVYKVAHYMTLLLLSLVSIIPFGVLLYLAFTTESIKRKEGLGLTFSNFTDTITKFDIIRALTNSFVITFGAILILIMASSFAGYAIARFKIFFNKAIYLLFLFSMMIPAIINSVPLYKVMHAIGGINSRWAMMLLLAANALPFATFLYAGFMSSIPEELEEAAIVDGANRLQVFFYIVLPLLTPVTASVVIINGIGIWNNYSQVVFYLQDQEVQTIPLAISMFFQQYGAQWHLMASATTMAMIPAVIVFVLGQKYFMKGLSAGAVKG
ncbi:carbohydrate ABC transporter permease [Bacillus sp. 03113]|uniref:carbohydrate ABC transporter permease n=1 Tax=Bacillus sp. 03113 TaxID=2578211 RepID=UPI001143CF14|nr:carbohydrate ABC transporter permease [Bacillus sp. 03113]